MIRLGLLVSAVVLAAACSSENTSITQPVQPVIGPPDTTEPAPPPDPRIVLYAGPYDETNLGSITVTLIPNENENEDH